MNTTEIAPEHAESMLRLIEASLQVKRRHQFYYWTQGDMQRLVPHRLSICGAYDLAERDVTLNVLNSVPLPQDLVSSLSNFQSPLMQHLLQEWVNGAAQVAWIDLQALAEHEESARGLCHHGYRWLLTDGVSRPGRPLDIETFFVFGQPGCSPDPQSAHLLNLLKPYLHATFLRVHTNEGDLAGQGQHLRGPAMAGGVDRPRAAASITDREREILRWVREGMSNQAISEELGISALTVKNHIQKILRKLGAANRAQAVAKAIAMNLFARHVEAPSRRLQKDVSAPTSA